MAVYPSSMAPISVKLWENAFQTIPSFFNTQKIFLAIFFANFGVDFFFQESGVLEEIGIFERHCRLLVENHYL